MKMLIGLRDWVDARLPIMRAWDTHMGKYYAPKNFNFWYFFGVLSLVVLVNQLLTGVWLTMSYTPSAEEASVLLNTSCATWNMAGSSAICIPPVLPHSLWWCTCTCSAPCFTAHTKSRVS